MVVDVKKAFLHGLATRTIYIELPEEESENGKYVGKLLRTLYGTRDAPQAWQKVVREDMHRMGFHESKFTSGVYVHHSRDIQVVAHVDDFLVSAEPRDAKWFKEELARRYELKVETIGWEPGDKRELEFLGRRIKAR